MNKQYESDMEDFKLPYQLQSRTDREVMEDKYKKLNKVSYGYIVRLGIANKADSSSIYG